MASLTFEADRGGVEKTPEPPLEFGGLVLSAPGKRTDGRLPRRIVMSVVIHALVIGALAIAPLLREPEMPESSQGVRAFFVTPALAPPPPPPPPPPAASAPRAAAVAQVARAADSHQLLAPIDVPSDIPAGDAFDLGVDGGVPGGVDGGVVGGVPGGLVGGLGDAAPMAVKPIRVGHDVREPRKIKHVSPVYPSLAQVARVQGAVVIECIIGIDGRVETTKVLQSMPLLDQAALDAVRQWRYTPTLYQGVPVPVIMTVTVTFAFHGA